jgi:hypothetical protein
VTGGVLQRNNVHLAVCAEGRVGETLAALRLSSKTASAKAKFVLATDGVTLEAHDLAADEALGCPYAEFADRFAFFLPLAGISTVKAIKNNPVDIKATGRLNKLYIELLKDNPDWAATDRRHDMIQVMARLIFCFFAEDTGIFLPQLFTAVVRQFADSQSGNTSAVIAELFRAMDTRIEHRAVGNFRPWADQFPYVNGGMFNCGAPRIAPRICSPPRLALTHPHSTYLTQIEPNANSRRLRSADRMALLSQPMKLIWRSPFHSASPRVPFSLKKTKRAPSCTTRVALPCFPGAH